jgi:hypothetical protein
MSSARSRGEFVSCRRLHSVIFWPSPTTLSPQASTNLSRGALAHTCSSLTLAPCARMKPQSPLAVAHRAGATGSSLGMRLALLCRRLWLLGSQCQIWFLFEWSTRLIVFNLCFQEYKGKGRPKIQFPWSPKVITTLVAFVCANKCRFLFYGEFMLLSIMVVFVCRQPFRF